MNRIQRAVLFALMFVSVPATLLSQSVTFAGATTMRANGSLLFGITVDAAGNVFYTDNSAKTVVKLPAGGGAPITIASSFSEPLGVAVDNAGNVFFSDYSRNTVSEVPAGGGAPTTVITGLNFPRQVAVDSQGNLYVADRNGVHELAAGASRPASAGALTAVGSGLSNAIGVAVDAAGNVYVAAGNSVVKVAPNAGPQTTLIASGVLPLELAVDAKGNVFVGDETGNGEILEIPVGGGPRFLWWAMSKFRKLWPWMRQEISTSPTVLPPPDCLNCNILRLTSEASMCVREGSGLRRAARRQR